MTEPPAEPFLGIDQSLILETPVPPTVGRIQRGVCQPRNISRGAIYDFEIRFNEARGISLFYEAAGFTRNPVFNDWRDSVESFADMADYVYKWYRDSRQPPFSSGDGGVTKTKQNYDQYLSDNELIRTKPEFAFWTVVTSDGFTPTRAFLYYTCDSVLSTGTVNMDRSEAWCKSFGSTCSSSNCCVGGYCGATCSSSKCGDSSYFYVGTTNSGGCYFGAKRYLGCKLTPLSTETVLENVDASKCYTFKLDLRRFTDGEGKSIRRWPSSFCFQPNVSDICLRDEIRQEDITTCFPSGEDPLQSFNYEYCVNYSNEVRENDSTELEVLFETTCSSYRSLDLNACKCTNARDFTEFQALERIPGYDVTKKVCFWKYCQLKEELQFVNKEDRDQECGGNFCVSAVDVQDLTESEINNLKQTVSCFNNEITPLDPTLTEGSDGVILTGGGGGPITETLLKDPVAIAIIGGIGVLLIIVIAGLVYLIYKANRKEEPETKKKVETDPKPAATPKKKEESGFSLFGSSDKKPQPKPKPAATGAKKAAPGFFSTVFGSGAKDTKAPKPSATKASAPAKPAPVAKGPSKAELAKQKKQKEKSRAETFEKLERVAFFAIPGIVLAIVSFLIYWFIIREEESDTKLSGFGRPLTFSTECTVVNRDILTVSASNRGQIADLISRNGLVSDFDTATLEESTPMVFKTTSSSSRILENQDLVREIFEELEKILKQEIIVVVDQDVATGNNPVPRPNQKLTVYPAQGAEVGNILNLYTVPIDALITVRKVVLTYGPLDLIVNKTCSPGNMPQRNSLCTEVDEAFVIPSYEPCPDCYPNQDGFASYGTLAVPGIPPRDVSKCRSVCIRAGSACSGFNVDRDTGECFFFSGTPVETFDKDENDNPLNYCYLKV